MVVQCRSFAAVLGGNPNAILRSGYRLRLCEPVKGSRWPTPHSVALTHSARVFFVASPR
jgi:hypothetical protein